MGDKKHNEDNLALKRLMSGLPEPVAVAAEYDKNEGGEKMSIKKWFTWTRSKSREG